MFLNRIATVILAVKGKLDLWSTVKGHVDDTFVTNR